MSSTRARFRPTPASFSLLVVVAAAAVAMAWDLDALGWGNQYYAAVAQSGAHSEWGFFNATPDLAAVTGTDKPPLAFWPMSIAVWLVGLHGWAVALPQVVESVATVALLALLVRRVSGTVGAAVAAAALASTPIFFVLARFDDPDT
ncbi:MAG: glycosyltransferase family 39 protein, partial [Nostocoides sp.]